jgi:hypothetical protein
LDGVHWFYVTQERAQWRLLWKGAFHKMQWFSLTSRGSLNFSRWTLLRGVSFAFLVASTQSFQIRLVMIVICRTVLLRDWTVCTQKLQKCKKLCHIIGLSQVAESENALCMTLFSAERWEFASVVSWSRSGFPCFLCYRLPAVNLTFVVGSRFTSDSRFSATACIPLSANDMQFTCDV